MSGLDEFRLTRKQTASLARALRSADWVAGLPGEVSATLVHPDGTEVTIDVRRPILPPRVVVVRGFVP